MSNRGWQGPELRGQSIGSRFAEGDKIAVPLVVFVDEMVRARILITGDLQDKCPVEQTVNIGKLLWRFGKLEQVASLAGHARE